MALLCGWALFQSWPFAAFMTSALLPLHADELFGWRYFYWPISLLFLVLCLAVFALRALSVQDQLGRPACAAFFGVLFLSGTLLMIASGLALALPRVAIVCGVAGAALSGVGSSFLHVRWQSLFLPLSRNELDVCVPVGYGVSIVLGLLVSVAPNGVNAALLVAFAVVSLVILLAIENMPSLSLQRADADAESGLSASSGQGDERETGSGISAKTWVCTLVAFVILWMALEFVEGEVAPLRTVNDAFFVLRALSGLVIAVVFISSDYLYSRSVEGLFTVKSSFALVGVALLLVALGGGAFRLGAYVLGFAANSIVHVFVVVASVRAARSGRPSIVSTTVCLFIPMYAGPALAVVLRQVLSVYQVEHAATAMLVLVLFAVLFTLSGALGMQGPTAPIVEQQEEQSVSAAPVYVDPVAVLAERYGLTNRETEVFALFASGRDSGYIREKLVISRDTVSSHLKHIYTKMGIHSKRELLDMVDVVRSGDSQH